MPPSTAPRDADPIGTSRSAPPPERWWPVIFVVLGIAVAFTVFGLIGLFTLFMLRAGQLDIFNSGLAQGLPSPATVSLIRSDLFTFAAASSKSFVIVVPIVATVLATVLVWLAIPAAGTSSDADRIRQVREVISQSSHLCTSALIAWVLATTGLSMWLGRPAGSNEAIDPSGLVTAWVLLPVVFILGICCGRFTGGDAKYRFDSARIEFDRIDRHVAWLDPASYPEGKRPRTSPRWFRPSSEHRWVRDIVLIAVPQTVLALGALPISLLFVGSSPASVLAFVFAPLNLGIAVGILILAIVTIAALYSVLRAGGAMGTFIALAYVVGVSAVVITLLFAQFRFDPESAAAVQFMAWTFLAVIVVQLIVLLLPYGAGGTPVANYALCSATAARDDAAASLDRARDALRQVREQQPDGQPTSLLTRGQARKYLNVTRATLGKLEKSMVLASNTVHGDVRFTKRELDRFLSSVDQQSHP